MLLLKYFTKSVCNILYASLSSFPAHLYRTWLYCWDSLYLWCEMLWYGLFELQVCLEHAFHLLCNGLIDEAYQNLSLAESWRFGEQTAIQDKEMKLIQAYRGLLDYYSWCKQKNILLEHGKS